jgi:hypothetical protein
VKFFAGFLLLTAFLALVSCDSGEDAGVPDKGYRYFPLAVGRYQVYDVTEITYTLRDPDTARYALQVKTVDAFVDTDGDSTYVMYRSKRLPGETAWTYLDTWSARRTADALVVQEENTPYVKLRFPPYDGQKWNGNAYNSGETENYTLDSLGQAQTRGGQQFDDCLTVVQRDNQDFIVFLDQQKEVYAAGIGLIYKETTQLSYCTQPSCLAQQLVEQGVIYKQWLKEYGKTE